MAENNLLMTIVLVVAATLLFSGGLTGNASREAFGFSTVKPSLDNFGDVTCVPEKEGKVLAGNDAVIVRINEDCSEDIIADCEDLTSQPFVTKQVSPQRFEVTCRGLQQSSSTNPITRVQ